MTDQNSDKNSDDLAEEIRQAYSLFVVNAEYKERFLMAIGLTCTTARIVINLEHPSYARLPKIKRISKEFRKNQGKIRIFKTNLKISTQIGRFHTFLVKLFRFCGENS